MSRYSFRSLLYWLLLTELVGISSWQCRPADQESAISPRTILAVSLENSAVLGSAYDDISHTWTLQVPYLTNLRGLRPTLTLAEGVSVVPRSGEVQNFTKPVYYTVTEASGKKTVYKLIVQPTGQSKPQITSASTDTLEAGQSIRLTGHSFGMFRLDVQVIATGPDNLTVMLTTTLLDSTQVRAELPFTLPPGRYNLQVLVRKLPSQNSQEIYVQYPSPQLLPLQRQHLRGGDTLWIEGLYVDPSSYRYALRVDNGKYSRLLPSLITRENSFAVWLDSTLSAGRYRVQLVNQSENKISRDTTSSLQLYDRTKPFVTGILSPKSSYAPGKSVILKAVNFSTVSARFYQLQLIGAHTSYIVNGIYDPSRQQLTVIMPAQADKGTYTLSVRLLGTAGQTVYSFDTDEQFTLL